jgi:hypothetical protein
MQDINKWIYDIPVYILDRKNLGLNISEKCKTYLLSVLGFKNVYNKVPLKGNNDIKLFNEYASILESLINNETVDKVIVTYSDVIFDSEFNKKFKQLNFDFLNLDFFSFGGKFGWYQDVNYTFIDINTLEIFQKTKNFILNSQILSSEMFFVNKKFAKICLDIIYKNKNLESKLEINKINSFTFHISKQNIKNAALTHKINPYNNSAYIFDDITRGLVFKDIKYVENPLVEAEIIKNKDWIEVDEEEIFDYKTEKFSDKLFFSPKIKISSAGIKNLKDIILSPSGVLLNNKYAPFTCLTQVGPIQSRLYFHSKSFERHCLESKNLKNFKKIHLNGNYLHLDSLNTNNYAYTLLSEIPKLEMISRYFDFDYFDNIHVPYSKNFKHFNIVKEFFGIKESQILPNLDCPNTCYYINNAIVPTIRGIPSIYNSKSFKLFNDIFNIKNTKNNERRLYISRASANKRFLENEDEVISLLKTYDFEVIDPSTDNRFLPQIFSEASIIIGLHGANLADCCFCKKNSNLIEIIQPDHIFPFYVSLAKAVGMKYHSIMATKTEGKEKISILNLNKLQKLLSSISII